MNIAVRKAEAHHVDGDGIARFAAAILSAEGLDDETEVAIAFITNDEIAELNETHMGKTGPTDVLSFPIEDGTPGSPPRRAPDGPPVDLGDIFIATDVVTQHAEQFQVGFEDELHLMVCHGLLHLLGWDHQTDVEAEAMESREAMHLAAAGLVRRS